MRRLILVPTLMLGLSALPVSAQVPEVDAGADAVAPQIITQTGDTLQSVLASVYRTNPQLLAERARVREVDETYVQARAEGRPNLSVGGQASLQATRSPNAGANPFVPAGQDWVDTQPRNASVDLVQPLYQGGRVQALKEQAGANILAARAGLRLAENNVFLSAANAYVDLLRDEETARIRRNNVRVLTRQLEAADARFELGVGTRTEVAQSRSRLAAAEAGLALADAQTQITRATFVRFVGRLPDRPAAMPDFVLPDTLEEAITLSGLNNPQLSAAYYAELAGRAAVDVAKAARRPNVSLSSSFVSSRGTLLGFQDQDQATVGATISLPLYAGGANDSRVRQARTAQTRLRYETRDVERAVAEVVTQVWSRLEASRRVVDTSLQQVEAAEIAYEGVLLEQEVGTRTQLDVLDAEQETLDARLSLLNARRDFDASVLQLLAVMGVLDVEGIDLPVAVYDPDEHFSDIADDVLARTVRSVDPGLFGPPERITSPEQLIRDDAYPERSGVDPD